MGKKSGLSRGLRQLMSGDARRQRLLYAVIEESLELTIQKQARKSTIRSIIFEKRPFGMTPSKTEGDSEESGYVVQSVNHNDPSKPASRLGVRPGWKVSVVNETDVSGMSLDSVQSLLKETALPIHVEFAVPPKDGSSPVCDDLA